MGRSTSDNFKRRFGDPPRIALKFDKKKASFVEDADKSKKLADAAIGILRGVLGRDPTQDEILGKVDISERRRRKTG